MWTLYGTATKTGQRPSALLGYWVDPWTALQFDNAVTLVGTVIEGALNEMERTGPENKPQYQPKYRLEQLLDPAFRLPRPPTDKERKKAAIEALKGMARRYRAVQYRKVPSPTSGRGAEAQEHE